MIVDYRKTEIQTEYMKRREMIYITYREKQIDLNEWLSNALFETTEEEMHKLAAIKPPPSQAPVT